MVEQLWRAIAAFRLVTLVYAAVLILRDRHGYAHPAAGLLALAVMAGWTAFVTAAYAGPRCAGAGSSPPTSWSSAWRRRGTPSTASSCC